jgi:PKD repeat protein
MWNTSHNVVSSYITYYKITKEYIEPTTFDIVVNEVTYTINKPYISAPALDTAYWLISAFGDIVAAVYNAPYIDKGALNCRNCWKTKEDAKAYLKVKKIRDDFEIGEIQ